MFIQKKFVKHFWKHWKVKKIPKTKVDNHFSLGSLSDVGVGIERLSTM